LRTFLFAKAGKSPTVFMRHLPPCWGASFDVT
jgi:hypothetical protein